MTTALGFFFQGLFRAIGSAFKAAFRAIRSAFRAVLQSAIGRAIIQILACAGPQSTIACMTTVAALTLATGGSVVDAIKSAAFAFVQMEAFSQVGAYLREVGLASNFLAKGLVHGVVGGAMSMAQGGGFVQGFAGSAIGAAGGLLASGSGSPFGTYGDGITELALARAAVSAAAGCAASAVTGGKCAQAAVTAAFASLYNGDRGMIGTQSGESMTSFIARTEGGGLGHPDYDALRANAPFGDCWEVGCGAGDLLFAAATSAPALKIGKFFNLNRLPQGLQDAVYDTLRHMNNGTIPDGTTAKRWGHPYRGVGLPKGNLYKSYDVVVSGQSGFGTNRIIVGSDGSRYFTGTHYKSFGRIR